MQPLHDKVLIRQLPEEEMTSGGLYIPDIAKEKPLKGEVIACGPGRYTRGGTVHPLEVVPGNKVLFAPHQGVEVEIKGEPFLVMSEFHVLAVLES